MKTIKYKIYILAVALSFASCKKALVEDPAYTINNVTAFESESTANMALLGCYAYLTEYSTYGQNLQEALVGPSGLTFGQNNNPGYAEFASLNVSETNVTIEQSWRGLYKVIGECNYFISSVGKSSLSDSYKARAIGEARFLRALCYFNLANLFGGVPLRIEPTTSETVNMARSSREEVYAQAEQDWLFAAENLGPEKVSGRASKYAAYAYLAKLYWMLGSHDNSPSSPNWAKAKKMGDIVLTEGGFGLETRFADVFKNHSSNSPESIFQINFSTATNGYGNRGNWVFSASNTSNPGISWARYRASRAFYDHFRGTYPDDPRLSATFGTRIKLIKTNGNVMFTYPYLYSTPVNASTRATDSIRYTQLADPTNPGLSELTPAMQAAFVNTGNRDHGWPYFIKQFDATATAQNSGKNLMVYRYADFLLLMADVENELNNTPTAIGYVNRVLSRARRSAIGAIYPQDITAMSVDALRNRIFDERLFELAGEFDLFTDVRRRGTEYFEKVLNRHDNHQITKAQVAYNKTLGNNQPFMDYMILTDVSNVEDFLKKNLLLPIPRNEISNNEGILDTDQNYGY